MICKRCGVLMKHVMRFENGKSYELYRCPKCWYETKKKPLFFFDNLNTQQKKKWNKERRNK